MPESNAAAKKRIQKANRAAGIGDEQGRLVRVKDPPKMSKCTVCQLEMTITKTNTELGLHATSKHGKELDECFPGAAAVAAELVALAGLKSKGGSSTTTRGQTGGLTKAQLKKKGEEDMLGLLDVGLTKKKKGRK